MRGCKRFLCRCCTLEGVWSGCPGMIPCKTFLSDEIPLFSSAKSRTNNGGNFDLFRTEARHPAAESYVHALETFAQRAGAQGVIMRWGNAGLGLAIMQVEYEKKTFYLTAGLFRSHAMTRRIPAKERARLVYSYSTKMPLACLQAQITTTRDWPMTTAGSRVRGRAQRKI